MIRFFNGKVLTVTGGIKITDDEVWTDGEKITYIGPEKEEMPRFDRQVDLRGDLLMPGFKDAHTHTAMVFARSLADDMPLESWLSEQIWPSEHQLDEEAVYDLTKIGIMEYLTSGITAGFDMYVKNDAYAQANIDSGFRTVICSGLNNFDADMTNIEREYLKYNSLHPLISYTLGIHGEYTTCMERMEYLASLAEKYKAPCYMHLCETKGEVQGCLDRYGLTPPQLLDRLGFFNYGGGGFHCVWMSDEDIDLFARRGLWAVTNPSSNLKLASGIAPIAKMQRAGVKLAIGTDSAGSNNALDMFREMYLVTALQKYYENDPSACDALSVLEMATAGSAGAMCLDDCRDIAVGMKADLIVIDLSRPNMRPINNIAKNIVYSGSKENVRLTMVNGKILYENGEFFIGDKPEDIYRRAEKFMNRIR